MLRIARRCYSTEAPVMAKIRTSLKDAMKASDDARKTTIRAVLAEYKNASIADPASVANDIRVHALLRSLIRKRDKSATEYEAGGRKDLADKERGEIRVLEELGKQVDMASESDVAERVAELAQKLNIKPGDKSGMGKLMSLIKPDMVESQWKTSTANAAVAVKKFMTQQQKRSYSTHSNPLVSK